MVFFKCYLTLKENSLLKAADHAYHFMRECCEDKENGGVFWSVTYDGKVADSTKHTYNQAFAIMHFLLTMQHLVKRSTGIC